MFQSIKKYQEIKFVINNGTKACGTFFTIFFISRESCKFDAKYEADKMLTAILLTKKLGNAVVRNKIRRRYKALFKTYINKLDGKSTYVLIARKGMDSCDFGALEVGIGKAFSFIYRKNNDKKIDPDSLSS